MSAQWKPGDVAMIEVGCHANVHRGMFIGGGWRYGDDKWVADDPAIVTARPLLVIDPEDREQVERLRALLEGMSYSAWACGALDCLRTALRSLVQPEPPRCVAHGNEACASCSLITTADFSGGECRHCTVYGETGMHWDTCPGRIKGVVYATRDEAMEATR